MEITFWYFSSPEKNPIDFLKLKLKLLRYFISNKKSPKLAKTTTRYLGSSKYQIIESRKRRILRRAEAFVTFGVLSIFASLRHRGQRLSFASAVTSLLYIGAAYAAEKSIDFLEITWHTCESIFSEEFVEKV